MDAMTYISTLERMGRADYKYHAKYRVKVPVGEAGPWRVRKFETKMDLAYMRHARDGRPPGLGEFTALNHKDRGIVMSDTTPEIEDVLRYIHKLEGNLLVTGLGLGMVPHILTTLPEHSERIKTITIVELDKDVIKLTGPHYKKDKRISIVKGDALTWLPEKGVKFDTAWHDIWDSGPDSEEVAAIKDHYKKVVPKSRQFCWGQHMLRRRGQW